MATTTRKRKSTRAPAAKRKNTKSPASKRKKLTNPFDQQRKPRVDLRLAFGSIAAVDSEAVVLGLFEGIEELSPAVREIDERMDGAITAICQRRMFTGKVGEVFILPADRHDIRANLVVCHGMGRFDAFEPAVLQIVAENVARVLVRAKVGDFATVLFGASRGDLYDGLANLVDGFFRGVRGTHARNPLRSITVCETDRLRCKEIEREIAKLYGTRRSEDVVVSLEKITLPEVPNRSASRGPRSVILQTTQIPSGKEGKTTIRFSVLGAGDKATALSETITIDEQKLRDLVAEVDDEPGFIHDHSEGRLEHFGSKLAKTVVPTRIARALKKSVGKRRIVVLQDTGTSRIPWETLCIDGYFPAAEGGMSRQFIADHMPVARWLEHRQFDDVLDVLLIVNPTKDLPAAEREGKAIKAAVKGLPGIKITELRGPVATTERVKEELRSGQYDVLHFAGHTSFDPKDPELTGMLCKDYFCVTGTELSKLHNLPALVVFNSCESARIGGMTQEGVSTGARGLARNIGLAEALLRGGVANYVGTHWQLGDESAPPFIKAFYGALLNGETVGTAVSNGRKAVKKLGSKDWADYVHYGSPNFVLKVRHGESRALT